MGINDVDVQILLHLEAFAAVLAQVVVEGSVDVTVMFLLTMTSYILTLHCGRMSNFLFKFI